MTDESTVTIGSPREIHDIRFSQRLRGYDEAEVHAFLRETGAQVQKHQDNEAALRSEIERLQASRQRGGPDEGHCPLQPGADRC